MFVTPKKTSIEIENRIIELLKENMTIAEVSRVIGVTGKVVKRIGIENHILFTKASNSKTDYNLEKLIICDYNKGFSNKYLKQKYNLSSSTITRVLNRNNIHRKNNINNLLDEDIVEICNLYKKGFSTVDIQIIFKDKVKCDNTISKILKNNEITIGTPGTNSYITNENYFGNIDCEAKAYFLGFIYADGNIGVDRSNNKLYFQMMLQSQDYYILEMLRDDIGVKNKIANIDDKTVSYIPKPLIHSRSKNEYSLRFQNQSICKDLMKHGVVPNKTFKLDTLPNIKDDLMRHFIRGYFDGDGSIKRNNKYYNCSFYGQYCFLECLQNYLIKEIDIRKTKICSGNERNTVYSFTNGAFNDMKKIYNYLYNNSIIYLDRKHKKFDAYVNTEVTN